MPNPKVDLLTGEIYTGTDENSCWLHEFPDQTLRDLQTTINNEWIRRDARAEGEH